MSAQSESQSRRYPNPRSAYVCARTHASACSCGLCTVLGNCCMLPRPLRSRCGSCDGMSRVVSCVTLLVHEDGTRTPARARPAAATGIRVSDKQSSDLRSSVLARVALAARGGGARRESRFYSRACAQYAWSFYELFILCSITRPLPWFGFPINSGSAASHSAWCVRFISGARRAVPSNALGVDQPSACADQ